MRIYPRLAARIIGARNSLAIQPSRASAALIDAGLGSNTVLLDVFFINFPLRNRKRPKQRNRDVHRHVARCASIVAAIG